MDPITELIAAPDPRPFALLRREGADHIEVYTAGAVTTADRLADIPLPSGSPGPKTLALVPYRQVRERGFACVDDGAPLECLPISSTVDVPMGTALAALPAAPVAALDGRFDISDEEYAGIVETVLRDEIGRGEGANFVIHRTYTARVDEPLRAALAAFRRLLVAEKGAYWTFLVHTGERTMVGATPERHVSVEDGLVMMNPISGTFRHPDGPPDRDELLRFLADPKEVDELYMVLDEELKMMATVAEHGGQVVGPYLKEMAHLTHTEYLLAGRGSLDVREVLRETMFAPTVTGSPIENACRVIARHERRGRRYYAAVLALLGHDEAGRQTLDAPILIRTAEFTPDGVVRVPVGATLVRHSTTAGEVAETYAKAAGILAALGLAPAAGRPRAAAAGLAQDPEVRAALAARNAHLARFWLEERAVPGPAASGLRSAATREGGALQAPGPARAERAPASTAPKADGSRVLIVDGEDTFTGMLRHQLRAMGRSVTMRRWSSVGSVDEFDLVIAGPGPGDPTLPDDPKMVAMRRVIADRLDQGAPLLAVCLGHQLLCGLLGLTLHRRDAPYQGLQREVDLFGERRRVGFYSTFTALSLASFLDTPYGRVEVARDPLDAAVHGLRGPAFAGIQFHPESVLSEDGVDVLQDLLVHLGSPLTSELA